MMPRHLPRILLILSILWVAWLLMMLTHESGHVPGALATGGTVRQVVWHPAVLSRTDVQPNPHPLIELWAGPLTGCLLPLLAAGIVQVLRLRTAYLFWVIAGFCLIANGAYIGLGALDPVGDARDLIAHGMPRWSLALFGAISALAGLWLWHRISPHLGFGPTPAPANPHHAWTAFAIALLLTIVGFAFGNPGGA